MSDVLSLARQYLAEDPDHDPGRAIGALVEQAAAGDAAALNELQDRFGDPLQFGTAGLRGKVEGGISRMNRVVVQKATWGLGTYLVGEPAWEARKRGVVIAFDGRYSSRAFAEDAAAVLCAMGIPVHLYDDPQPTPLCAFTVTRLGAVAGIMVTASHNPPRDNGYKVYWTNGAQIIPPQDRGIAEGIARAPRVPELRKMWAPDAVAAGLRQAVPDSVVGAYLEGVRAMGHHEPKGPPLRLVYTAMHGVGHHLAVRALRAAGFDGVAAVPAQADPDGAFRTVAFPNPEEKGALDLSFQVAREMDAELVLANDPDADRLAVAVRLADGSFRQLTGNEVGVLLGADALEHAKGDGRRKLVVTTVVSSTMLGRMARDHDAVCAETLTGFKWIANEALRLEPLGHQFLLGYEEALGYSVGPLVRDKDGVGAAVRFAEMARYLKGQGKTLWQRLDELMVKHGASHGANWAVVLPGRDGMERIKGTMRKLRANPPRALDGSPVERTVDLEQGVEVDRSGVKKPAALPVSDVLQFYAEDGTRLTVRPSGTEPKIKFYVELVKRVGAVEELAAAREEMEGRAGRIRAALSGL